MIIIYVFQDGDFEWPKEIQGLILASFFWGYAVTQVPGGWLATRFGGKRVFGWSMFITAIATLLCPIAAKFHYILLLVFRFIAGLGEVGWMYSTDIKFPHQLTGRLVVQTPTDNMSIEMSIKCQAQQ